MIDSVPDFTGVDCVINISISTVSTCVQRIFEKLHVRTRREVIASHKEGA